LNYYTGQLELLPYCSEEGLQKPAWMNALTSSNSSMGRVNARLREEKIPLAGRPTCDYAFGGQVRLWQAILWHEYCFKNGKMEIPCDEFS